MATPQWKAPRGLENTWGFDKNAMPPWFMVEHRAWKDMTLDFAIGKSVKSINPRIAPIKELGMDGQSRIIQIEGKLPGPARIEVRDPRTNKLETALDVSVKSRKLISISFHFVEDKVGDATTRKFDEVGDIIKELNSIYSLQTNIIFKSRQASPLKVDIDLDDVVDARLNDKGELLTGEAFIYGKGIWKKIFATKSDRLADFNVYFVPAPQPNNRNDLLFFDGNNCVIEDGVLVPEFILAHAIGRMFGCAPTSSPAQMHHLMYWGPATVSYFTPRTDNFIPKEWANRMNPW